MSAPPAGAPETTREPLTVQIEVTSRCNLACRLCPHAGVAETGDMPLATFARIVDQLARRPDLLYLCGLGEPLLHLELEAMIAHAVGRGIDTTIIHTNGTRLSRRRTDSLAAAGLAEVRLSLDGGDAATLARMRPGTRLSHLVTEMRHMTGATPIRASLYFTGNQQNIASLPGLADVALEMGVRRIFVVDMVPFSDAAPGALWATRDRKLAAAGAGRDEALETLRARCGEHGIDLVESLESSLTACAAPFSKLYVTWKGEVTPCCRIHRAPAVGDLTRGTLRQVWHGPELEAWRARLVSGDPHPLCRTLCNLPVAARRGGQAA